MFSGYSAGMCQMSLRCSMSQAAGLSKRIYITLCKGREGFVGFFFFLYTAFSSGLVTYGAALVAEYTETPNLYP